MKKQVCYTTILLLGIFAIMGCNTNSIPKDFDYGRIENNKYINDFFDFQISVPEKWVVQSKEEMQAQTDRGRELIAGDNALKKAIIKASEIKTAQLLCVYQFNKDTFVTSNPNYMIMAENLSNFSGIKTGSDYLVQVKKGLDQTNLNYKTDNESVKEKIDGNEFYKMNASANYNGIEINQIYYSAILKGFCLTIILTYITENEKQELLNVINSLKFRDNSGASGL